MTKQDNTPKSERAKKKFLFLVVLAFLLMAFVVVFLLITYFNGISEKDFNNYISYDDQFLEVEAEYLNEAGYVEPDKVPSLLDDIEDITQTGKAEGIIKDYNRSEYNIYIEFSSGIKYMFIPMEEGKLSNGDGGKILTVEPVEDTFAVKKESLMTFINKYYNKFEYTGSFSPIGNANLIKKEYDEEYEYDSIALEDFTTTHKYSLTNEEVTVDSIKKWDEYKVIIFEGHGAYNSELHSCLVTGESFIGFKDFSKYKDDIENNNIILTSFPTIPGTNAPYSPIRKYCVTSNFIDRYLGEMDDSLIFLGACCSVKDDVFAQALINKGAAIVMGYNETTSMEYEMMTRTMFFYGLTKVDEQGNSPTIVQALNYAKESVASCDPWGGSSAELVCVSKNEMENRYTLKGIKSEDIPKENKTFADQYYEQLVSTVGLADDHIETKIRTTEDQGASTICLAPEDAKLGIIFKDIADFDKNGIDDLIVVSLDEYDGHMLLNQAVYYFDAEGEYTTTSHSNDTPIHGNCNYYFYKVNNYMINILEEDISGDRIDGLYYEVIDDEVKIHGNHINIFDYDINTPDNGESDGQILYIHKDFRDNDNVCYTVDDTDGYYAIYNRGFSLSSSEDKCLDSEEEGCEYINSLLKDLLDGSIAQIKPTTWDNRWNVSFFPHESLPDSYTALKISASPSYKTGEKTTESDVIIEAEYINSRSVN